MPTPYALETERLLLRQWRPDDFEPFRRLNADPEVMRYFPAPLTAEESDAIAQRCSGLIDGRGWGFWAAEHRETRAFIGFLGLHVPAADLPFSPCVEIGWRLARSWWGQGLATEGARAALDFAFDTLKLDEVVAFTALLNLRSQAVMRRLGMIRDAAPFEHPSLPVGHVLRLHCLYRARRAGTGVRAGPKEFSPLQRG